MRGVVITGTSSGLGRQLFELLANSDLAVCAIARRFHPDQKELENSGRVRLVSCDLGRFGAKDCERICAAIDFDEVIFLNNAGVIDPIAQVGRLQVDEMENSVAVNFLAPLQITNGLAAIVRRMSGRLTVVNITSGAAAHPIAGWDMYCSTKAALRMALDVAASEGNFEVIHVDPGVIDTPMQDRIRSASNDDFPGLPRFLELKAQNTLQDARTVASRILKEHVFI